jgi:asparagine synthase (glutamine-hydrolysing)
MCGIFAGQKPPQKNALSHRGPDFFNEVCVKNTHLLFWRLAINGLGPVGHQPFERNGKYLIANAEIYNHTEFGGDPEGSDCEVILPLIEKHGLFHTCDILRGDFAFIVTDGEMTWAARDAVGVRPLFYCRSSQGISFASEMKALTHLGRNINIFPPGHLYDSKLDSFVCWSPNYWDVPIMPHNPSIKTILYESVLIRVYNSKRPVGFFLSGGLDSSIIAALGKRALGGRINTFSIGLDGSPDLLAARKMAEFLDSNHTEVLFTIEEGLKAIPDVIWNLETFDTTTVRASIPMYLLSEYIKKNTDIRVILSGEGSDELFGGYLYFHGAPDVASFKAETNRLVRDVHMFDVLRADRSTSAHGLELRVPFFDREFIDYVMNGINSELKLPKDGYEKYILRKAFEDILPPEICWRQKNGMSDAVGYAWVDALRDFGEHKYKDIFNEYFGDNDHVVPYKWMPKWTSVTDPSARILPQFNGE